MKYKLKFNVTKDDELKIEKALKDTETKLLELVKKPIEDIWDLDEVSQKIDNGYEGNHAISDTYQKLILNNIEKGKIEEGIGRIVRNVMLLNVGDKVEFTIETGMKKNGMNISAVFGVFTFDEGLSLAIRNKEQEISDYTKEMLDIESDMELDEEINEQAEYDNINYNEEESELSEIENDIYDEYNDDMLDDILNELNDI